MTNARERAAYGRIAAKRRYRVHVAALLVVSGLLTTVWAQGDQGFYWPVFLLGGWGLHLVVCGFELYVRPITPRQIAAEVERSHTLMRDAR